MHAQLGLVRQDAAVVRRAVRRSNGRADDADHSVAEREVHEVRRASEELRGERVLAREPGSAGVSVAESRMATASRSSTCPDWKVNSAAVSGTFSASGGTLTNPGTRLSCAAEVAAAQRPGTGVFAGSACVNTVSVSAHEEIRGMRRVSRRWATGVVVFGTQGVLAAYPQADLPTIKQFRVPLSIRERSS